MKTIADAWATYAEQVVPADASDAQMKETKRAFYAGAHQTLCTMTALSAKLSEDDAMKAISAMHSEAENFCLDIEEGRA